MQVVTSAFRPLPEWSRLNKVNVVVSIDGLQPEHDVRRKPATYDRILKNIAGQAITIHCTITGRCWSARVIWRIPEVLDAQPRNSEGLVQHFYSASGETNGGASDEGGAGEASRR